MLAVTLGRLAVAVACGPWVHAARTDGLGAIVIGSVTPTRPVIAGALAAVVAVVAAAAGPLPWAPLCSGGHSRRSGSHVGLGWLAQRRFGGSSGDVLGATAELATLAVLLVLALQ